MRDNTQIIKSANLKVVDYAIILSHLGISLGIWFWFEQQYFSKDYLKDFTHFYFLVVPFAIVGIFYLRLRNIYFYSIWIFIGIVQLLLYPELNKISEFHFFRGSAFSGMRALLPALIVFQLLRTTFLLTHKKEIIVSLRHYRMSTWEDSENRHMTWIEVGFSLILYATIIISIW